MVEYRRMYRNTFRYSALIGIAFLAVFQSPVTNAATLRDEAVNYRVQGYEQQRRGDLAGALSSYQKAAALDPTYATPHNDMGVIFEQQGRQQAAEQAFNNALALNPEHLEAHANLAMLYERLGNKEQAVFHWIKRYQLGDPYDPWTARAEERLIGLGVLKTHPGLKGAIYHRHRVVNEAFQAHTKSIEEFHAVTKQSGDWP